MTTRRGCPVDYPKDPVDGYELTWWVVEEARSELEIHQARAVYKSKATWAEAVPERAGQNGAAFENEWMAYWRGKFVGRNPGWNIYRESRRFDWSEAYATEAEAVEAAVRIAADRLESARKSVDDYARQLAVLQLRVGANVAQQPKGAEDQR